MMDGMAEPDHNSRLLTVATELCTNRLTVIRSIKFRFARRSCAIISVSSSLPRIDPVPSLQTCAY